MSTLGYFPGNEVNHMDLQHYKIANTHAPKGTATWSSWGVSGCKTSADNYTSYEINVYRHWYVYRHKPKWFGQHSGDRYLGRLRWVSQHADGKQWKNLYQHGSINGLKVQGKDEKETDAIASGLIRTYGYVAPYFHEDLRKSWYASHYPQSIRCVCCGQTQAETRRNRHAMYMDMRWPKGNFARFMPEWDAHIISRESVTCKCPYQPRQDVIQHHIETGEGLRYD